MKKIIDGRKLPCPQPLMMTKKAVDAGDTEILEVIVDNEAGRENIIKYTKHVKIEITDIFEVNGEIHLIINTRKPSPEKAKKMEDTLPPECLDEKDEAIKSEQAESSYLDSRDKKNIFIRTDTIGTANRELGLLLMRGFIYTLTELEIKPETIIFMNDGVKLTVEGSESIENIRKLEETGVKILVCGTCLDYLHLTEQLQVGTVSNMYDITEELMKQNTVLTV